MPIIFNSTDQTVTNRGRAVALEIPGTTPGSILDVEGWGDGFRQRKSIFTSVTIAEASNYQFLHTLGNRIYIYVFGDRIGQFSLSGISFFDNCTPDRRTGISHVIQFYRDNRITVRPGPVKVTLDPDTVLSCYLIGMRGAVMQPVSDRMFQFSLSFALLPTREEPPLNVGFPPDVPDQSIEATDPIFIGGSQREQFV